MSDRDSDEDVGSYFQAFKTVAVSSKSIVFGTTIRVEVKFSLLKIKGLRLQPLQLPSIPNADDTTDADSGSDDSEVPDIVFSSINWDDVRLQIILHAVSSCQRFIGCHV